jgi:radical SAM protein with 4Fe4S-binding SPASM domain
MLTSDICKIPEPEAGSVAMESHFFPALGKRITLRSESFGGYLFDPRAYGSVDLGTVEFLIATLCNGQHSIQEIISRVAADEKWGFPQAQETAWHALRRFHRLSVVEWLLEPLREPRFAEVPTLSERDQTVLGRALSAPLTVLWDVTYACNLSCPHCLTGSGRAAPDEMNRQEKLALIDQLVDMRVFSITLCGGEPLVCPHLFDVIEKAISRGMDVSLDTNGLWVTEEIVRKLADTGVSAVQVSLDGREETHDQFRGRKGSFKAAVRSIELFVQSKYQVTMAPVLTAMTHQDLEFLVELAVAKGAASLKPSLFLPTGRGRENAQKLMLSPPEARADFQKLMQLQEIHKGKIKIAVDGSYPGLREYQGSPPGGDSAAGATVGCPAGVTQLVIAANGMITACPFLYEMPAGHLREKPLAQIWREARIFKVFRQMTKGQLKGHCRSCPRLPGQCAGGCRAAAYALTGDIYGQDPLCWLNNR